MFLYLLSLTMLTPQPTAPISVGQPRYYFILYGGQSLQFRPRSAHTFATFVKASMAREGTVLVESHTISWLPANGVVRPWRLVSERGRNYTLDESFEFAAQNQARVSMWGPFEIDAGWYDRVVEQVQRLESGAVRYRVLDSFGFNNRVMHCVRAITTADTIRHPFPQPVIQVGEPGTSRLAGRYARKGVFLGGSVTHDWVLTAIGASHYPVVHRTPGEHVRRHWRRG